MAIALAMASRANVSVYVKQRIITELVPDCTISPFLYIAAIGVKLPSELLKNETVVTGVTAKIAGKVHVAITSWLKEVVAGTVISGDQHHCVPLASLTQSPLALEPCSIIAPSASAPTMHAQLGRGAGGRVYV